MDASAAPAGPRALDAPRRRTAELALAAGALAGVVGILKGVTPTLDADAEFYWRFSYEHGFIKRGLLGTLVRPLLSLFSFEQLKPAIIAAHLIACGVVIALFYGLFAATIRREPRADSRVVLVLSFACLMSTQLLAVLAHDTGNADVWLIALTLGGFSLARHARYRAAAVIALIGPLVHEGFVFLWSPVAILLIWSVIGPIARLRRGYRGSAAARPPDRLEEEGRTVDPPAARRWKIALAVLPAVIALAVTRVHNPAAVARLMDAWPVSEAIKSGHQVYTFGQTLQSSFAHMRDFEFRGHWDNFAKAAAFFLVPNLLLIWAAGYCFWRRWTAPLATLLVAGAAMLAPLAVVAIGWDLSRFLCWSTVAAGVALVGVGSDAFWRCARPVLKRAAHTIAISTALAAASIFYLCAPTVYAYFSEVRLSYSSVPAWFIRTAPARLTAAIFADYNDDSPLAARFRTSASCSLADEGALRTPGCAHELPQGGRAYGPAALKLSPGLYVARFAFSESDSCSGNGEAKLEVAATGRFGRLLASYSGPINPTERIDVPFTVKAMDAGFNDIQFAAAGLTGCVVLRRLDLDELAPDSY